jgi:Tetracyclin repressor-like, C-terminal domain
VSLQECLFHQSITFRRRGRSSRQVGPGHVDGPVHLADLWSRIILEDFHHQSCVVGQNDTGLQHAQESDLALGLAEGSRGIDCHIGIQPLTNGTDGGKTRLDKQFDRLMAEEENFEGCFTRAYIRAAFSEGAAERKVWGALLSLMAAKDQFGWVWDIWLSERLKRHSKTDSRIELRVVRLAADGVWLERIMTAKSKHLKGVEEYLIEMTRIRKLLELFQTGD